MGVLALLAPFIPQLVTLAESLIGRHNGQTKLDLVVGQVQKIVDGLGLLGKLPGPPPPTGDIITEVNKVAGQLFPSGTTVSATTPVPTPVPLTPAASLPDKDTIRKIILWALS